MPRFILLELDGVMQSWGGHTYEDWRPTELFPTRSGLLGLIGACIGIERTDTANLNRLAASLRFAVCSGSRTITENHRVKSIRLCDYHTIEYARKVDGKQNENPVQSYRWYLFDAVFAVAVEEMPNAPVTLEVITTKLCKPIFTPFLGRRSCPISQPLLADNRNPLANIFEASDAIEALNKSGVNGSVMYTEATELATEHKLRIRDVPMYGRIRQFSTREVSIHADKEK
ncbi:MAG: type I-E CRISPR-associated protein Cas5/CasD [Chitinispirillaceae bacterium]|nr:type I-E CRISPR-associated protein Cas5/CasD [Chitinispirillaceae bacterium]